MAFHGLNTLSRLIQVLFVADLRLSRASKKLEGIDLRSEWADLMSGWGDFRS